MKITIITGPFLPVPPAPCGAVERVWHELAGEFAARGHDVTVLCRSHQDQQPNETIHAIRFIRRTQFKRSRRLWWDLARDLVYSCRMLPLVPPSDVVVTNSFWLPILLPMLCRRAGKTVVNVARVPKGQIAWYRRVDRLAAVSNAIRQEIALQCPDAVPMTKVIANPIDTGIFFRQSGDFLHTNHSLFSMPGESILKRDWIFSSGVSDDCMTTAKMWSFAFWDLLLWIRAAEVSSTWQASNS